MSTSCDRCRDQLPFHAAGTLPADAAARVTKHIATCTACRAALDEWLLLGGAARLESDAVGSELPPIEPVLERIRRGPQLEDALRSPRISATGRRVLSATVLIAILLLLGTLAIRPQLRGRLAGRPQAEPASTAGPSHVDADVGGTTGGTAGGTTRTGDGVDAGPASVGVHPTLESTRPTQVVRRSPDASQDRLALGPSVTAPALTGGASATRLPQAVSAPASTPTRPVVGAVTLSAPVAMPTAAEATYRAPTTVPASATVETTTATDVPVTATHAPATMATVVTATATDAPATPAELTVTPSAESTGIITGRVVGSDGGGRAEVYVRAYFLDRPDEPAPPARTDATGAYSLTVASGRWLVGAEGSGFQARWYRDALDTNAAEAVHVSPGTVVSGTDLQLPANPSGTVTGRVTRPDGTFVARAVIVALRLENPADPTDPGRLEAVAFSGADGSYRLSVRQGVYGLGLRPSWWSSPVSWWDGKASLTACDLIGVDDGQVTEGVDFTLP